MKKVLFIILGLLVFLVIAAIAIPLLFKDQIKAKLDAEIAKSINGNVYYDAESFNLSLIRRFPNVSVGIDNFGIVGKDEFSKDTLVSIGGFETSINLMSVIKGGQIKINAVRMDKPRFSVIYLENGKANFDIFVTDTAATATEETPSTDQVSFGIDNWEINDGYLRYEDKAMKMLMVLNGLQHSGSGDFTLDIFDMKTKTYAASTVFEFDGIRYLNEAKVDLDMVLNMDLPKFKFIFKENEAKINDFAFGFDGYFAMPADDMDMDIKFATKKNTFKSLLSLVPGVFLEGFEDIKTEGDLTFNGFVKGIYNETKMPAFNVNLKVNNAMMQYPNLPTAIKNINVDMLVDNKDGVIDNTLIDIKTFHLDMGNNPVDGRVKVQGLGIMDIDAQIMAKLNLAELNAMFPMDSISMKGLFNLDLKAKGIYQDSVRMPAIDAVMSLKDGMVKALAFPIPLEQINVSSTVKNSSGQMADTKINVDAFSMVLENEKLEGKAYIENLDNYTWDVSLKGGLDIEKLMKVYPMEGMKLAGKIKADIQTKGKMSDLDAGRYDKMPTSGTLDLANFKYETVDMPLVTISQASMVFNPEKMTLSKMSGSAGKSDFNMSGVLTNYLAYVVKPNAVLKGKMNFSSTTFDTNEWMSEEEAPASDTASVPMTVFEVPKNIDFVMSSQIGTVLYDNLTMTNMKGDIIVRDGTIRMNQLGFNTLGGAMTMNGTYDSRDKTKPLFDFDLNIDKMNIKSAYQAFNTIKKLAPVAEKMDGNFSTNFKIAGGLGQDMMPLYNTLLGGGLINITQAAVSNLSLLNKIKAVTKLTGGTDNATLKDILLQAEVKEGRVFFKPFDITSGNQKFSIGGSQGVDGTIDYNVKTNMPAGAAKAISSAVSSAIGQNVTTGDIKVNLKVLGTFSDPKVSIAGTEKGDNAGSQDSGVKAAVSAPIEAVKEDLDAKRKEAEEQARQEKEAAEAKAREEAEKIRKEAEEKAKKEADKLKDKLGFPKKKKDN